SMRDGPLSQASGAGSYFLEKNGFVSEREVFYFHGVDFSKWVRSMASDGGAEAVRTPRPRGGNGAPPGLDRAGRATSYPTWQPCGEILPPEDNCGSGDFDVPVRQFRIHPHQGLSGGIERFVETGNEEAGFEAGGAEEACWARAIRSTAKSSCELMGL